ncbi:hypothetical protein Metbo_1107 [Methanobacterium lacus]|uniref:Ion transport 2 domain protein n=1 Tax=Methanobacterium lacus (strain AL-21) TaxID=877455 RepID=F0T5V9_METLA|nr:hypothetical protein [Methanobacterium lacus]ADZ09352.1 hypothetical protein Metbo_1107 [Methanobacterium lacus]
MRCKYKYEYFPCYEDTYKNYDYCILHLQPNMDFNEDDMYKIEKLKHIKINEKIKNGDFNFDGIFVRDIYFENMEISKDMSFRGALFEEFHFNSSIVTGNIDFSDAKITKWVDFTKSKIDGNAIFTSAKLPYKGLFEKFKVKYNVDFENCSLEGYLALNESNIGGRLNFASTKMESLNLNSSRIGSLILDHTQLTGNLYAQNAAIWGMVVNNSSAKFMNFDESKITKDVELYSNSFKEGISFDKTSFIVPLSQEKTSRYVKNIWEKLGDRNKADYYFYREMEAKRLQKGKLKRFLEYVFVQWAFEYGSNPYKVLGLWLILILGFSLIYGILNAVEGIANPLDYIYFSVFAGTGFDYASYHLKDGFQFLASIEVIFAIFIWGAFLVIFSRKYMR